MQHYTMAQLPGMVGKDLATSDWLTVDQERINRFAEATDDHQWIHVDVERAREESPYGAPIAHGFLTLSLLARFSGQLLRAEGVKLGLNYGLDRVRFITPVRVGSRLRARFTLTGITDVEGGVQVSWTATVEIEGSEKPACVAQMLVRWLV